MTPSPTPQPAQAPHAAGQQYSRSPKKLMALALAVGLACGAGWLMCSHLDETTEDAYVDGNVVQVTPQTAGTVTTIRADNTDFVPAGAPLVTLDDDDARIALARAEAQLARTVRQVAGQFASAAQMQANIDMRKADLARAQQDMISRAPLVKTGAVPAEEYRHAEEAVQSATAALEAAGQQSAGTHALVERVSIANHPDVIAAAMQVQDAWLALRRTVLRAPVAGMVTRRNAQVGQRVTPGAPLMSIVALDQLWVSANFKESQLRNLRVGQVARITADVYGQSVVYNGRIIGLDAGTGSAFTLMPAQNATGNWIKVVQRLPVRIALNPAELAAHPLRLGLSLKVAVDTHTSAGQPLAIGRTAPRQTCATDVFRIDKQGADDLVRGIIAANTLTGHAGSPG